MGPNQEQTPFLDTLPNPQKLFKMLFFLTILIQHFIFSLPVVSVSSQWCNTSLLTRIPANLCPRTGHLQRL